MIGMKPDETRLQSADEAPGHLRVGLIAALILAAFGLFILRLFQLQILEGADLANRSQRNSVRTLRLEAPRGEIVDREGRILAAARPAYRALVIPSEVQAPERTYRVLAELLAQDSEEMAALVGEKTGRRRFQPVQVEGDLSPRQRARVETHRFALPGVVTDMTPRRHYLGSKLAAHLLGMIGEISAEELASEEFKGYRRGDIVGKTGLEVAHESHLRGLVGGRNVVVDVSGQEIEAIDEIMPVPGGRVVLTLDADLQHIAEESFKAQNSESEDHRGALVAMDPRNGEILAMVSNPAYDPNAFSGGIDSASWEELISDDRNPLRNRAIAGQYPPGSTYKALVAVAGLSEGILDPEEKVYCPGEYELGGHTYRCWKHGGHGEVNFNEALLRSCDVYFYELGNKLGVDTIASYAARFGLGNSTGISLSGELPGLIPTREWKQRVRGESWLKGETISAAIGQGFDLVTPIQLARAYATLVNGGVLRRPRLIKGLETWDGIPLEVDAADGVEETGLDPEILDRVRQGLIAVVEDSGGSGKRARVEGVRVGGKTGTSQVVRLGLTEGLEPEEIPVHHRDHALFVAFAPAEAPEIVVAVVVEHAGQGGGVVAAPIAQKVLAGYFEKRTRRMARGSSGVEEGENGVLPGVWSVPRSSH